MITLLGFQPLPNDLNRFERVRAHLERETGNGVVSKTAVLRFALKCAAAGIAPDAPDVPRSSPGRSQRVECEVSNY